MESTSTVVVLDNTFDIQYTMVPGGTIAHGAIIISGTYKLIQSNNYSVQGNSSVQYVVGTMTYSSIM